MSAAFDVDRARHFATRLERIEKQRSGHKLEVVRQRVAHNVGLAPGTLENLRRCRTKDIRKSVYDSLERGLIRELEAEMRRYEHELQTLRQSGTHPGSDEISSVETGLAAVREALGLEP